MDCLLSDEEMDKDGDLKNVKLSKKKESPPVNSSIRRTCATEKHQRDINNLKALLMNKQQREIKYMDDEEGTHIWY